MLFYNHLEEIVFGRHEVIEADELFIISGYIGPNPVIRLAELPFATTVVYGMYGVDGIRVNLHNNLLSIQNNQPGIRILYSNSAVHSKCYIWKFHNRIAHALIGSANFSANGLGTPNKEVLAETTVDTFQPLEEYLNLILNNSISCLDGIATVRPAHIQRLPQRTTPYCTMTLFDPETGEVPGTSGLNWGQNPRNHTNPNDAYIPIRSTHIDTYPELFPPKNLNINHENGLGRVRRQNEAIDIIWDDGTIMMGLLEGTYHRNGTVYPKQIGSFPSKRILGEYIRRRINVASGSRVYLQDLVRYGRTHIDISLQSEGVYFFDFSVH